MHEAPSLLNDASSDVNTLTSQNLDDGGNHEHLDIELSASRKVKAFFTYSIEYECVVHTDVVCHFWSPFKCIQFELFCLWFPHSSRMSHNFISDSEQSGSSGPLYTLAMNLCNGRQWLGIHSQTSGIVSIVSFTFTLEAYP